MCGSLNQEMRDKIHPMTRRHSTPHSATDADATPRAGHDAEAQIFAAEIGAEVPEVDLHGMDRLDAERAINQMIDQAFMAGDRVVRIVHGVGQGILRDMARDLLGRHPLVETWRPAAGTQRTGVTYAVIAKK